jgi:hypothetical protein
VIGNLIIRERRRRIEIDTRGEEKGRFGGRRNVLGIVPTAMRPLAR